MADVEWDLPDGSIGVFPDTMSDQQIRQIIAHAFPREVGEAGAAVPGNQRDMTGHYAFDGSNIPGYDPQSGIVSGGALDDSLLNEVGIGARQTMEGIGGLGGDVYNLLVSGTEKLAEVAGVPPQVRRHIRESTEGKNWLPDSGEVAEKVTNPVLGEVASDPLTTEGKYARTGGNFFMGALAPGSMLRKALSVALPAGLSEGGAQAAEGTGYVPYARLLGALTGSAATIPRIGAAATVKQAASDLGVKTQDMTKLIKQMQADGLTPQQIQTRMAELGPDAMLMDVGPNLRQEGQRIVAKGGEGRTTITNALEARDQGANARIRGDVEANFGPPVIPSRVTAQIDEGQAALSPAYEAVLANGRAVDTTRIAQQLEGDVVNLRGAAQQHARRMRDMLNVTGTNQLDPNPRTLHEVRKAIDGILTTETDPNAIRVLARTRADVDRQLAQAVPGIKDVDAQFAELARQNTALQRGQQTLSKGREAPRPEELVDEVAQGALPQGTQVGPSAVPLRLRQGNRAEVERLIGTTANDRVALRNAVGGQGDWNRDRLATLYGPAPTDRVISALDRETTFDTTSNRAIRNSATAERLPEGASGMSVKDAFSAGGPKAIAYSGLVKGVDAVIDRFRGAAGAAQDARMAGLLTNTNSQQIATALLKANGGKPFPPEQLESRIRALLQAQGNIGAAQTEPINHR